MRPRKQTSRSSAIRISSLDGIVLSENPIEFGSSADVFKGVHQTNSNLALKRIRVVASGYTSAQIRQFKREVGRWHDLNHPNILPFYGTAEENRYMYLISPWMDKGTLPEYLRAHPRADRKTYILQIAEVILYLHQHEIVHGDIKASNILISPTSTALLSDFGLSKMANDKTSESIKGSGTVRYMSPELLDGQPRTFASDVYAFGVLISVILSGNCPFQQYDNTAAVVRAITVRGERPDMRPLKSEGGECYEGLWGCAAACWDEKMDRRPTMASTVQEMNTEAGKWQFDGRTGARGWKEIRMPSLPCQGSYGLGYFGPVNPRTSGNQKSP